MPSNIALVEKSRGGYILPNGCSWNPPIKNNKKEGTVEVFDRKRRIVAKLEYKNDKLNGLCEFYENGILVREIYYTNDIVNGWGCEYDECGENASDFFYVNGEKRSKLKKSEIKKGYYDEVDLKSGEVISTCLYNEKHERVNRGYIFKNGMIDKIVVYENGKEKRLWKEFNEGEMIEYDNNGKKVYEGGYQYSLELDYPREGQGEEYGEKEDYEGEWKNNKRNGKGTSFKNGRAYYLGMWKDGLPEGEGRLYNGGKLLCKGDKWVKGWLELESGEIVEYKDITELVIKEGMVKLLKALSCEK